MISMQEIHDNLPNIVLPLFTIFDWVIIVIIFFFISFFVWRMLLKSKEIIDNPVEKIFVPKKFSFEKELRFLNKLKNQSDWKAFALFASRLLKNILEQKFKRPFQFATGKELKVLLKADLNAEEMKNLSRFFNFLDPVKFAGGEAKENSTHEVIAYLNSFNKL